jgi:hypothetical protein
MGSTWHSSPIAVATTSIYWQRADGSGETERLTMAPAGATHAPESFSPDGGIPAVEEYGRGGLNAVGMVAPGSVAGACRRRIDARPQRQFLARRPWIEYTTPGNGTVVRPFPLTAARYQVPIPEQSAILAIHPVWSRKASELIYSVGPGLLATTTVDTRSAVEFGAPSVVQIPGTGDPPVRSWDLTPDGQHFVRVIETDRDGTLQPRPTSSINWFEELKARLPAR